MEIVKGKESEARPTQPKKRRRESRARARAGAWKATRTVNPSNAFAPMVSASGRSSTARAPQPRKALSPTAIASEETETIEGDCAKEAGPIEVTEAGMAASSFPDPRKTSSSIWARPGRSDAHLRIEQLWNAEAPIEVTVSRIEMFVRPEAEKASEPIGRSP
jgi:hypothetical protein